MNTGGKPRRKQAGTRKPAAGAERERAKAPVAESSGESEQKPERIAKLLARAGIASRREAERMITGGRVSLNGKPLTSPAVNVTPDDRVEVDGEPIRGIERTRLWLYHKPVGLVTTHKDPEGRPTVFENLPLEQQHIVSIGRLDINTEGLLLLTNDGGLARELELPTTGWLRRYRVRAHGTIDQAALDRLQEGMAVDGVLYGAIDATLDRTQGSNVWITMGLREGKNREIKNVLGALGLEVNRLIRISYGPFQLASLKEGGVQEVRSRTLRDQLGPKLIERAGANFEAPLYDDGSTGDGKKKQAASKPRKDTKSDGPPPRKLDRTEKRDRALERLDTRKSDGDKPRSKRPEARSRASNVWMAPGARPVAGKGGKSGSDSKPKKTGARSGDQKKARGKPQRKGQAGKAGHADRRR